MHGKKYRRSACGTDKRAAGIHHITEIEREVEIEREERTTGLQVYL